MTTKEFQERSDLRIFLSYFKPHKKLFVLDMVCALTIALIDLAFPYLSRWCMYELLPQNAYRTFFTVMLPQVVSPLTALFMCEFIGRWNDSMAPLVYLPNMPTLASGLYVYQIVTSRAINYPVLFAALMMCLVPVLVLYFIFQESLMDLQLSGGIKG